ncbi:putative membrane protein [Scopulibacillus darangshiensis]|uniref:Putative membrane protein n=1 Tax=Scopulibacillus darangshiensis TaxID=442528 RepID=A0A4R2NKN0_9BACL|nr:DUF975 family protein [Scopulibacillus darangshiensis]TCP21932.1 putative membrane protein [Scopulibacillus darangshiensis]
MRVRDIKRDARAALKGQWGFAVLVSFLALFIYSAVPIVIESIISGGFWDFIYDETALSAALGYILPIFLFPILMGHYWVYLSMVRRENVEVKGIFKPFTTSLQYWKSVGVSFLVNIYIMLWMLLFIIPGIIKGIAYSQVYFILKDHPDIQVNDAVTMSRRMMDGYKGKYFLMQLSFIGWWILSILTLGIGLFWLVPYIMASTASFYENLKLESEKEI